MLFQAKSYLRYLTKAQSVDRIKDTILLSILSKAFDEEKEYYSFLTLSAMRKKLSKDTRVIEINDLGAGSKKLKSNSRTVYSIANLSVKKPKYAEAIFRIIETCQSQNIVELGTSLGVTTAYMSMANSKSKITTIEGCAETAKIAKENFKLINAKNLTLLEGNFDNVLPQLLKETVLLDFVFVDGNHTYEATMRYFQLFKEKVTANAIMVFDDIYWSEGMNKAWEEIKSDTSVQCSVDVFEMGFIFFDKKFTKADYVLKY